MTTACRPTRVGHELVQLAKWVKLEDTSTLGRFQRTGEIDPIDDANEPDAERHAPRDRTKDVAKKLDSLRWVQLDRPYLM